MTKRRADEDALLPLPDGARVEHLDDGLALLSFPLPQAQVPDALTPAEQDVALRVYAGASNAAIARERGVSTKTIINQLETIYRKLNVCSRIELVLLLRGRRDAG